MAGQGDPPATATARPDGRPACPAAEVLATITPDDLAFQYQAQCGYCFTTATPTGEGLVIPTGSIPTPPPTATAGPTATGSGGPVTATVGPSATAPVTETPGPTDIPADACRDALLSAAAEDLGDGRYRFDFANEFQFGHTYSWQGYNFQPTWDESGTHWDSGAAAVMSVPGEDLALGMALDLGVSCVISGVEVQLSDGLHVDVEIGEGERFYDWREGEALWLGETAFVRNSVTDPEDFPTHGRWVRVFALPRDTSTAVRVRSITLQVEGPAGYPRQYRSQCGQSLVNNTGAFAAGNGVYRWDFEDWYSEARPGELDGQVDPARWHYSETWEVRTDEYGFEGARQAGDALYGYYHSTQSGWAYLNGVLDFGIACEVEQVRVEWWRSRWRGLGLASAFGGGYQGAEFYYNENDDAGWSTRTVTLPEGWTAADAPVYGCTGHVLVGNCRGTLPVTARYLGLWGGGSNESRALWVEVRVNELGGLPLEDTPTPTPTRTATATATPTGTGTAGPTPSATAVGGGEDFVCDPPVFDEHDPDTDVDLPQPTGQEYCFDVLPVIDINLAGIGLARVYFPGARLCLAMYTMPGIRLLGIEIGLDWFIFVILIGFVIRRVLQL